MRYDEQIATLRKKLGIVPERPAMTPNEMLQAGVLPRDPFEGTESVEANDEPFVDHWRLAVLEMLKRSRYVEDVIAMHHFAFHARVNRCSSSCILCEATDALDPFDVDTHDEDCPYRVALERTLGKETLSEFAERV